KSASNYKKTASFLSGLPQEGGNSSNPSTCTNLEHSGSVQRTLPRQQLSMFPSLKQRKNSMNLFGKGGYLVPPPFSQTWEQLEVYRCRALVRILRTQLMVSMPRSEKLHCLASMALVLLA